jgi:hypothetical protein
MDVVFVVGGSRHGRAIADAPMTTWLHREVVDYWESERASTE